MSLDVWLKLPGVEHTVDARIFIREDGQNKEISRAEWDKRYPGREPWTIAATETDIVYEANITSNLYPMAKEAGIGDALWDPQELGITHAGQLIVPLRTGLELLESDPLRFERMNPSNGWGTYGGLVDFVRGYITACEQYPDAEVSIWA